MPALGNSAAKTLVDLQLGATNPVSLYQPGVGTHLSTLVAEDARGPKTVTHTVQLASQAVFTSLVLPTLQTVSRQAQFRLGNAAGAWRPWEQHRILSCTPDTQAALGGTGFTVVFITADWLATLDVDQRVLARRGTIPDLAATLAQTYGLDAAVEPGGRTYPLLQCFQTDLAFLAERLVPLAVNAQGLSNYQLYLAGDQLHFHTPGWLPGTVWQLAYNTSQATPTALRLTDAWAAAIKAGGSGVNSIIVDPLNSITLTKTNHALARRFANRLPDLPSRRYNARHTNPDRPGSSAAIAQRDYEHGRLAGYQLSVTVANQPLLRPGDLVQVSLPDPADPQGGTWYVTACHTSLQGQDATTVATLMRGELSGPTDAFAALQALDPDVVLTAPLTAPGILVDLASAQAAPQSRGDGPSVLADGSTVVPVSSPS
jgi:hypothetical protein